MSDGKCVQPFSLCWHLAAVLCLFPHPDAASGRGKRAETRLINSKKGAWILPWVCWDEEQLCKLGIILETPLGLAVQERQGLQHCARCPQGDAQRLQSILHFYGWG